MKKRILPLFLLPLIFTTLPSSASPSLSLGEYLLQMKAKSPKFQSSIEMIEGSQSSSKERDLVTMPKFSLSGTRNIDQRQYANPFAGRTTQNVYGLGLEKQFSFGLSSKLSYGLTNNSTTNLPSTFLGTYTQGQTGIDLSQSLWRNFLGAETKASSTLAEASSLATHYAERFKLRQALAEAENAYMRLSVAQEMLKLEKELLEGSKKILDWNTRRVQNHLADKIDMLQARSAYQARNLEVESTEDELRSAKLSFNTLRNDPSNEVTEEVSQPVVESLLALTLPERAEVSDDVKAFEESERLTVATQELSIQKLLPDLSLFGSAYANGVDANSSSAVSRSFTTANPDYSFGLKLNFPLNVFETSEIRAGRAKEQLSAEHQTAVKKNESEQTWKDLSQKFERAKTRLKLTHELVSMQKEKLEYEKYRFNLGRTTTYQVLVFEQDYAQALLSRLHIEQELYRIYSQLKVYSKASI